MHPQQRNDLEASLGYITLNQMTTEEVSSGSSQKGNHMISKVKTRFASKKMEQMLIYVQMKWKRAVGKVVEA